MNINLILGMAMGYFVYTEDGRKIAKDLIKSTVEETKNMLKPIKKESSEVKE